LTQFYANTDPDFTKNCTLAKQVLQEEKNLQEIVQLVGKDSLGEDQKVTLEVAKLLREDYLQQNGFSAYDYTCPLVKTAGMIRNFMKFYELSIKAVRSTQDNKITWSRIRNNLKNEYIALTSMKFIIPTIGDDLIRKQLQDLYDNMVKGFTELQHS